MDKYRKIYININSKCNYNCIGCLMSKNYRNKLDFISLDNIKNIIENKLNKLVNDNCKNIYEISGGEPTLHPNFKEISKYIHEIPNSYKTVLLTNGDKLSDNNFSNEISKYLDDFVISFYSIDKKQQDEITKVKGSCSNKLKAIENIIQLNKKVHIKTIVSAKTYKSIPEIAEFFGKLYGNKIHFTINSIHLIGEAWNNKNNLAIKYTDCSHYIEKAIDIASLYKMTVSLFFPACMIDPAYWEFLPIHYVESIKRSYSITPNGELNKAGLLLDEFINKNKTCNECIIKDRCNWPWEEYIKIFGDNEIIKGVIK